jgi:Protein of unknown function (DUF3102)
MKKQDNEKGTVFDNLFERDKARILSITRSIEQNIRTIKKSVYDIGRLLSEAKKVLPHGQFQPWIKETFGRELPVPTAEAYKAIYDHFKNKPDMVRYRPVSMLLLMKQKQFPSEIIELIQEDPEGYGKVIDIKTVKKISEAYKKGKKTLIEFWAETGKDIDIAFGLLSDKNRLKQFNSTQKNIKLGFSRIDTGLRLVKDLFISPPPSALIDYYIKEIDARIDGLQKTKTDLNAMHLSENRASNP